MNFSVRMIRKVSLKTDLFLVLFCWEKFLGVKVALEFIVDLMCLEIFPAEASDLRTLLPRKRGAERYLDRDIDFLFFTRGGMCWHRNDLWLKRVVFCCYVKTVAK